MNATEQRVLALLTQSAKTWREMVPSFLDRTGFNLALLRLERRGDIRYNLEDDRYEVVEA
jgi:hypothetical protein